MKNLTAFILSISFILFTATSAVVYADTLPLPDKYYGPYCPWLLFWCNYGFHPPPKQYAHRPYKWHYHL